MQEIIQSLEANITNGEENFCYISENKLNTLKELSKREYQELQQENKKYKEVIDNIKYYLEDSENQMSEDATYTLTHFIKEVE